MILHIFKKDVRLLWSYAAGNAIVGWVGTAMALQLNMGFTGIERFFGFAMLIKILAAATLIAAVIHTDPVPGVGQDWVTRPIARRDFIFAKLLFIVTMVLGPDVIGDIGQLLFDGFSLPQSIAAALTRAVCLLAIFYLPVLGIAAITRNFTESIVAVAAVTAVLIVFQQVIHSAPVTNWQNSTTGAQWVAEFAMAIILAIAGIALLAFQYTKRRTYAARCLTAVAGLLAISTTILIPWKPVFAIQRQFSPQPGGAADVQLAFEPARGRGRDLSNNPAPGREIKTPVLLPIDITGLGADTILRTDLLQARLTTPHGKVEKLGFGQYPQETREGPLLGKGGGYATIYVPTKLYSALRDHKVRIDLDYSLTLLHLKAAHAMPAVGGEQRIAEFGRCRTRINETGLAIAINCEQAAMTPPCVTMFLEHAPSGKRNPKMVLCAGPYTPFNTSTEPDTLRRLNVWLAVRDSTGKWQGEISDSEMRDSQVVTRWYDVVEHFSRHVEIPEVRLSDWLSL